MNGKPIGAMIHVFGKFFGEPTFWMILIFGNRNKKLNPHLVLVGCLF